MVDALKRLTSNTHFEKYPGLLKLDSLHMMLDFNCHQCMHMANALLQVVSEVWTYYLCTHTCICNDPRVSFEAVFAARVSPSSSSSSTPLKSVTGLRGESDGRASSSGCPQRMALGAKILIGKIRKTSMDYIDCSILKPCTCS